MNERTMYFEGLYRKSGYVAGLLYGVTLIITGIMLYVFGGYFAIEFEVPIMGILAIPATAILVLGIYVIVAGINLGRRTLKGDHTFRVVISYLAVIIAFSIIGLIFEIQLEAIMWVPGIEIVPMWASITALIGCIFLIIIAQVYRSPETRIAAGVMGIIGVVILVVGGLGLLDSPLFFGVEAGTVGAMGVVGLTVTAWILAAISALLYSLLDYIKYKPIPHLVLIIGFLLYGIGLIIAGFTNVSDAISLAQMTNWAIPFVVATLLTGIAGISISITSLLGVTTMGLSLAEIFVPAGKKPVKCPTCGTTIKLGDSFCKSCGTKLPEEQPVPPSGEAKKFCPSCGISVEPAVKFCSKCGSKLR